MVSLTDQMGRVLELRREPQRIVSLVPSITALILELGAGEKLVARTRFCTYPSDRVKGIPRIGGTKDLHLEEIKELKPDLIIGNKEENVRGQIEELAQEYPVFMTDVVTLQDNDDMIRAIGAILNKAREADRMVEGICKGFDALRSRSPKKRPIRVAYLIWKRPYMGAGGNNFINSVLQEMGLVNVLGDDPVSRYPEVKPDDPRLEEAEVLFLSSEPFPFKPDDRTELKKAFPEKQVLIVDAVYFSWYGSRMLEAPAYLSGILERISS